MFALNDPNITFGSTSARMKPAIRTKFTFGQFSMEEEMSFILEYLNMYFINLKIIIDKNTSENIPDSANIRRYVLCI